MENYLPTVQFDSSGHSDGVAVAGATVAKNHASLNSAVKTGNAAGDNQATENKGFSGVMSDVEHKADQHKSELVNSVTLRTDAAAEASESSPEASSTTAVLNAATLAIADAANNNTASLKPAAGGQTLPLPLATLPLPLTTLPQAGGSQAAVAVMSGAVPIHEGLLPGLSSAAHQAPISPQMAPRSSALTKAAAPHQALVVAQNSTLTAAVGLNTNHVDATAEDSVVVARPVSHSASGALPLTVQQSVASPLSKRDDLLSQAVSPQATAIAKELQTEKPAARAAMLGIPAAAQMHKTATVQHQLTPVAIDPAAVTTNDKSVVMAAKAAPANNQVPVAALLTSATGNKAEAPGHTIVESLLASRDSSKTDAESATALSRTSAKPVMNNPDSAAFKLMQAMPDTAMITQSTNAANANHAVLAASVPMPTTAAVTINAIHSEVTGLTNSIDTLDKNWHKAFSQNIVWQLDKGVSSAQIQLRPAHLGPVNIDMQIHQNQAVIVLSVARDSAREVLEQALPRLQAMLADQGLQVSEIKVTDQSASSSQQQSAQQWAQEQQHQQQQAFSQQLHEQLPSEKGDDGDTRYGQQGEDVGDDAVSTALLDSYA